jgi:hypothetical protein
MNLKVKGVKAEYINNSDNYTICKLMGSLTLVYGAAFSRKKMHNGVAFKDTTIARQVAKEMLVFCDVLDALNEVEK